KNKVESVAGCGFGVGNQARCETGRKCCDSEEKSKSMQQPKVTPNAKLAYNVNISLDLSKLTTTLNRLERSIKNGINKWYQSLVALDLGSTRCFYVEVMKILMEVCSQLLLIGEKMNSEYVVENVLKRYRRLWLGMKETQRNTTSLELLDFTVHNFYWFFYKVELGSSSPVCHWANSFKNFEWSNVSWIKLSSFSESKDTLASLQALTKLYDLFSGFLNYSWSRKLRISNFGPANR
ncbi:hypothetical protein Tco_0448181, partial [Tanacetum coccineum]